MKFFSKALAASILVATTISFSNCSRLSTEQQTVPEVSALPTSPATAKVDFRLPEWHKNATIYEVNLRHFTPEGTLQAFNQHLPRLKEMGIDILWFMPVHPISKLKRKGELGSPYAVADYKAVNPDFGTEADFRQMLKQAQDLGMHVIIDWVPNHTGWDNPWISEHPDWYTKNAAGEITDPLNPSTGESWGWTDVADLDYSNADMREGMIDAMKFWIEDIGIDGFRVDVAHGVPVDFWAQATNELYKVKPIFMLAEAEIPALVNSGAFVADYAWETHHLLNEIAKAQGANRSVAAALVQGNVAEGAAVGAEGMDDHVVSDIDAMLAKKDNAYNRGYQMQFTSNHDENAWSGTEFQRFGDGHLAFAVLTATFDGTLLYTGQESAVDKQYAFFSKDTIDWGNYSYAGFYKTLFDLKHRNQALWNGDAGGDLIKIPTTKDEDVYAFTREKNGDKVVVVINLSAEQQNINLNSSRVKGIYTDVFTEQSRQLQEGQSMLLQPWQYKVFSNK